MKLYAKPNMTDSDVIDLYYVWNQSGGPMKIMFAAVTSDNFDNDLQEALVQNEDEDWDLELELTLR